LCRGCGLCITTCPDEAIIMKPLDPSPLSMIADMLELGIFRRMNQ
jgi:ferredoxin